MAERSEVVEERAVQDGLAAYSVEVEVKASEDVPPGYRRTEVGVIPEDWQKQKIAFLAQIKRGASPRPIADSKWFDTKSEIGWLRISDVAREGKLIRATDQSLSDAGVARSRLVRPGNVVMSMAATVGRPAINCKTVCIHDGFVVFEKATVSSEFLYYLLLGIEDGWAERGQVGSQVNLNTHIIGSTPVALPATKEEQRAIATALSDADALIESLDHLIAKKRAIKRAAMQQLLTGQTRLPGFTGEWKTKRLGDVGTFNKGQGIRRDDVSDEGVPCIRYGEIYTRYGDCVLTPESRIPEAVAEAAFPLRTGDILFAGSGETAEEIGMCVAYLGEQPAFAGGDIVVLRPNEGVSAYLGRLLNHPRIAQQKARLGQGDAVVHISARNLAQIEVHLPKQEEQTAIAAVLSDMDTEIEKLEHRRDKVHKVKQGMMQQLLTGRVRLVEPNVAHSEVGARPEATKGHSKQFNEAVVISMLARHFGTEEFPLGRKRYTKLSYLLHRHIDGKVEDYLKKAAGPYNPKTKYGGAEKIALKKGYLKEHKGPRGHSGFIVADNVAEAECYFHNWYGADAVQWLDQFRFKSNDDLEVLATVDMAAQELRAGGREVDVSSVKGVIQSDAEWQPKLNRKVFSDEHIAQAITQSERLLRPFRKGVT